MKKKNLLLTLSCVSVLGVALVFASIGKGSNEMVEKNIDALAQNEGSIIICSAGDCGDCFETIPFWPHDLCKWTGRQEDYCSCD